MKRVLGFLLLVPVLLLALGAAVWLLFPQNEARRPPAFDALRAAILKDTRLEADITPTLAILGQPDLSKDVIVEFPHVPVAVDRAALTKQVIALAKVHLPQVPKVHVTFTGGEKEVPAVPQKK